MPQAQILEAPGGFGTQLGQQLGAGLGQGISGQINEYLQQKKVNNEQKRFESLGYPEPLARLAATATTGGKTEVLKQFLDEYKRGTLGQHQMQGQMTPNANIEAQDPLESVISTIKQQDQGLLPQEKFKRGAERYKTGLPVYQQANDKIRSFTRDKERIDILDKLNESKKLPKDLGRLNVNKEGNLRLPFASSPEAQRFVKTLNEFSAGAKDTFGSRVTNFDLQQYLQRFPTLLNSDEGRRQIVQQMKVVNDINSVYYKNLKKVFDKAGGSRHIDTDIAESIADQLSEKEVEKLVGKFDQIGQKSSIKEAPNSKEFIKMRDPSGALRNVPKNQAQQAQKAGYKLEQ